MSEEKETREEAPSDGKRRYLGMETPVDYHDTETEDERRRRLENKRNNK